MLASPPTLLCPVLIPASDSKIGFFDDSLSTHMQTTMSAYARRPPPTHSPCSKYGLSSSMTALITSDSCLFLWCGRAGQGARTCAQDVLRLRSLCPSAVGNLRSAWAVGLKCVLTTVLTWIGLGGRTQDLVCFDCSTLTLSWSMPPLSTTGITTDWHGG